MIDSYKGIIINMDIEKDRLNKEVVKQKRGKYIFQGVSVAGGIIILISLL
jgi:hypothetical protein